MDKEGKKPKTFVSTFRLAIQPKASAFHKERQKEDGLDTRTLMGNNKVEVSSATGKNKQTKKKETGKS